MRRQPILVLGIRFYDLGKGIYYYQSILYWLFPIASCLVCSSCLLPFWTQRATEEQRAAEEQPKQVLGNKLYVLGKGIYYYQPILYWLFSSVFCLVCSSCLLPFWTQRATEEQRAAEEQPIQVLGIWFYVLGKGIY
jgi:uncharacterized membrane protein